METSFVRLSISVIMITVLMNEKHGFKACLETERTALLQIKSFFISASDIEYKDSILSSWVDDEDDDGMPSDCCHWQRVKCNATTGRVMQLSLKNTTRLNYPYDWFPLLNMSLFHPLEELQSLDLSVNNFSYDSKVAAYDSLRSLKQLKILVLGRNYFDDSIFSYLNTLPSLCTLILHWNRIEGSQTNQGLANLQDLRVLDLSGNFNITSGSLTRLGLANLTNLKRLHLRFCGVTTIQGICELKNLFEMNLERNFIGSPLITCLKNLTRLKILDISSNQLNGSLPSVISNLTSLEYLDLSHNNFEGEMKELSLLDLSRNYFSGGLSQSVVTGCFSLELLDLSNNNFEGQFFSEYMNLTRLRHLYFENNNFSGKIKDGLLSSTSLQVLDISNNILSGHIPHWMGNFSSELEILSMSKNHLEGNVPVQLNNLERLRILDISENRLSGPMASSLNLSSVEHLSLQKNALNGLIPGELFRSCKLVTLNLRDNTFSGRIPHQINEHSNLRFLLLGGNHLQGPIPDQLCQLQKLAMMDLSRNKFSGSIPPCFANVLSWRVGSDDVLNGSKLNSPELDEEIEFGSLGNNRSSNTMFGMWRWLSALEKRAAIDERVEIEFAMKNRYEIYNGSNVNRVTGLDLSCNQLTGEIPSDIGQLQAILALNLSNNSLSGSIPESFSNLKMIESLDISYNKLTGQIPPQLTALNFLSIFNVSYNNLSGRTPDKGQFATFDESSYRGNPSLCAWLIQQKYSRTLKPTTTQASGAEEEEEEEDDDESAIDMVTLYSSFGASYVTVILVLIAILWINSYWRRLWFYSIDRCINTWYYWLSKYVLCR
ncbi:Receptor-like protein 15 [Citrus sinensis]|uniref:receptor-like protein 15 isoform X3 n=1 Tax=Citrus sinensis TaxID=2711 RepID=UPI002190BADE|nr:receptor-like protein 15 isoform X3 [Citrus sinensis]KAH9667275.1 Receptor-like protein 15 [Citrus sinensis]